MWTIDKRQRLLTAQLIAVVARYDSYFHQAIISPMTPSEPGVATVLAELLAFDSACPARQPSCLATSRLHVLDVAFPLGELRSQTKAMQKAAAYCGIKCHSISSRVGIDIASDRSRGQCTCSRAFTLRCHAMAAVAGLQASLTPIHS